LWIPVTVINPGAPQATDHHYLLAIAAKNCLAAAILAHQERCFFHLSQPQTSTTFWANSPRHRRYRHLHVSAIAHSITAAKRQLHKTRMKAWFGEIVQIIAARKGQATTIEKTGCKAEEAL
jgi:hypothetical protein